MSASTRASITRPVVAQPLPIVFERHAQPSALFAGQFMEPEVSSSNATTALSSCAVSVTVIGQRYLPVPIPFIFSSGHGAAPSAAPSLPIIKVGARYLASIVKVSVWGL